VFNNGTCHGLIAVIPLGGHTQPISIVGFKLEWKKAQKKAKKNIISDTINKIIPIFKPFLTYELWCPSKVASRITSRHHVNITPINNTKPKKNNKKPFL